MESRKSKESATTKKAEAPTSARQRHRLSSHGKSDSKVDIPRLAGPRNPNPTSDLDLVLRLEASIARLSRAAEALSRRQAAEILLHLCGHGYSPETWRALEDKQPSPEHARRQGLLLAHGLIHVNELAHCAVDLALDAIARGEQLDVRDVLVVGEILDRRLVVLRPDDPDDPDDASPAPEPLRDGERIALLDPEELQVLADARKGDKHCCGGGRRIRKAPRAE